MVFGKGIKKDRRKNKIINLNNISSFLSNQKYTILK